MRGHFGTTVQQRLMGSAAIAMIACAGPAMAQRRTFHVPAQPASRGIPAFAKQAGIQILANGGAVRAKRTNQVEGDYTVEDGLRQLLKGTGLVAGPAGATGIVTVQAATAAAGSSGEDVAAQINADVAEQRGIADILVIGSRSQNTDIRRTRDDAQPYAVFTQQDIQKSQATTLEDFFRTRLPSNTEAGSEAQRNNGTVSAGVGSTRSSIDLRGLGTNQTLILVDGRRLSDLSIQDQGSINGQQVTNSGQPDINGIPLAAIERVEVLSSTAGGIYGGNAVGGVINIILRHDYRGLEITANYQDTADLKYPNGRLDVVGGLALGSKTNITFSGAISRSGVLHAGDRPFSAEGVALGIQNYPSRFFSSATQVIRPPVSAAVNYYNSSRTPLTLKAAYGGGAIGSYFGTVPIGFSGSQLDLGNALKANAGSYNIQQPLGSSGKGRSLVSSPILQSFNVNVRRKLFSWLDLFGDFSRFENKSHANAAVSVPEIANLSATAANNPFNQAVSVVFDSPTLALPFHAKSVTKRLTAGGTARLPHRWAAGVDYTWNWEHSAQSYYNLPVDRVGSGCALLGIQPNQCTAVIGYSPTDTRSIINPFVSPDFSPFVLSTPPNDTSFSTSLRTASFRLSGPVVELPGGMVNFSGSVKRDIARENRGRSISRTFALNTDTQPYTGPNGVSYSIFAPAEQTTMSEYGELRIPLFSSRNAIPLLQAFELQLSLRHDAYRTESYKTAAASSTVSYDAAIATIGSLTQVAKNKSTNYTVAGKYSPVKWLTLRASYGTGFTEPTVNQVVTNVTTGSYFITDTLRGGTYQDSTQPYTRISGGVGNDFKPETSKSYSFGAIFQHDMGPGNLRLSVDYTRINKKNEITPVNFYTLVNQSSLYPANRIQRAPLTASDIALGYKAGLITYLDVTSVNLFRSSVQAYDFQGDYVFKTAKAGDFRVYALATYEPHFKQQIYADQPIFEFAGFGSGPLKWRGNAGIDWNIGQFSFQYNVQYYGPYKVYDPTDFDDPDPTLTSAAFYTQLQGSDHIRRQIYNDFYISYSFPASSGILKGVRVSGGIQNFLNTSPPIIATRNYAASGYSGYGDPRLRRFTLTLKKAIGN